MKILSVSVHSFGKLQNVKVDFKQGVNVFRYNNGYGKTTLASFIRAMLYGFTYRRTGGASDVSAWITWNSTEKIGGNMVVEHNGETYKIERFFGATAKQETLSVTNTKTQKPLNVADGVGEYFLGLTADSYDRSAYYPQESVEISSNENLNTRLAGMVQNAADDYDKVQENLRKYKKDLKYERGNGGKIFLLENERLNLQRQIEERKRAETQRVQADNRLKEISAEQHSIKQQSQEVTATIQKLQKQIASSAPSATEQATRVKVTELQSKLARLGNFQEDKAHCDALAEQIEKTPDEAKTQRPVSKPLLIAGIVLAIVGAIIAGVGLAGVGFPSQKYTVGIIGIGVLVVGAILAVVSFFVKPALRTMQAGEKEALISEYFSIASKYVYCQNLSYAETQKALWEKYAEYKGDARELDSLQKTLTNASPQLASLQEEETQQRSALERLQACAMELSAEQGRITEMRNNLQTDFVELQEQLEENEQQLAACKHSYAIATTVSQLLEQANEKLATSYLPDLCSQCEQLLSKVTGATYQLEMDQNFNVRVVVNGASRTLNSFSRGIREITLLCFRLAISRLLFGGQIPFLIIDDAFVNFDEDNFLRATSLIKDLAGTQVIYFTCHKRIGNLN